MKLLLLNNIPAFIVFIAVLLNACNTSNSESEKGIKKHIALRLEPGENNQRNSEGDFIQLKNGKILFVYTKFTGGTGDHASAHLASRFSDNGGMTWSKQDQVVLQNEGDMNIMSVSLVRLDTQKIGLFYLRKNSTKSCIPHLRISEDEGITWSDPICCIQEDGYYVLNNDRVVRLSSGRLLMPVALHQQSGNGITRHAAIKTFYSDDKGLTWQKGNDVPNPENVVLQEPGIVELSNEKLMLYCRTNQGSQYIAYSENKGKTWTEVSPSDIRSPLSPASIKRIPDSDDLLLIWNNNFKKGQDGGKRTPFNMAVSKNDGKTWEHIKAIESNPDGWYCYTAIEFVEDGVLLGHCAGNRNISNGLETTQITYLDWEWIYSDALSSPYVSVDSSGLIKLDCSEEDADIFYWLDNKVTHENAQLYTKPFQVDRMTRIFFQSKTNGKPDSELMSEYVGKDIVEAALGDVPDLQPGLQYRYYEGSLISTSGIKQLPVERTGIATSIGLSHAQKDENFAFEFNGYIQVPHDGLYRFFLESNDGSVLYMNDHVFINNDGRHGNFEKEAPIALERGFHKCHLKYFQEGGGKKLKLSWSGPGIPKTGVPDSVFYHTKPK